MIDEKKLIAEIREYIDEYKELDMQGVRNLKWCAMMEALELVESQPKVGEWIPCSERLPETDDVVLITVSNIDNNKLFVTPAVYQHPFFCTWNALAPEDKVIAWQPLPEPWEGEE